MTNKQEKIFYNICKYYHKYHTMPSQRELATYSKISQGTIYQYITKLVEYDLLHKGKMRFTVNGFKLYMQWEISKIK